MTHPNPQPNHYSVYPELVPCSFLQGNPAMVASGNVLTLTQWKVLFLLAGGRQQGLQGLHVNDELLVQGVGTTALGNVGSENRHKPDRVGFHRKHQPLHLSRLHKLGTASRLSQWVRPVKGDITLKTPSCFYLKALTKCPCVLMQRSKRKCISSYVMRLGQARWHHKHLKKTWEAGIIELNTEKWIKGMAQAM